MKFSPVFFGLVLVYCPLSAQYLPYPGSRTDLLTSAWFFTERRPESSGGGAGLGLTLQEGRPIPFGLQIGGGYVFQEKKGLYFPGGFGEVRITWKPWSFGPAGAGVFAGLRWDAGWIPGVRLGTEVDFRGYDRSYLFLRLEGGMDSTLVPNGAVALGLKINRTLVEVFPRPGVRVAIPARPFSPDGDGEADVVEFALHTSRPDKIKWWKLDVVDPEGRPVWSTGGQGPPPEILPWDGHQDGKALVDSAADYLVSFQVEDAIGRVEKASAALVTDILLIQEGGRARIRVPYIEFNPNTPVLASLDKNKMDSNREILQRLAGFFQKYPDYRFRILGHGNLINWQNPARAEAENRTILKPLSLKRAESVRSALEALGINRSRMEVEGKGGDEPLAPFGDLQNNWKNRRVEFILLK